MGYSIAWIAVETADHAALFEAVHVRPTDEPDEVFEAPIAGVALNNGWFLLVGQGAVNRLIEPELLQSISARWPCIACSADEHVTCSAVSFWRNGAEEWGVLHDSQKAIGHLAVTGKPPASFDALRGEDAYEIPLKLAKGITGFTHDEELTNLAGDGPVVFEDLAPGARPWWKFW